MENLSKKCRNRNDCIETPYGKLYCEIFHLFASNNENCDNICEEIENQ